MGLAEASSCIPPIPLGGGYLTKKGQSFLDSTGSFRPVCWVCVHGRRLLRKLPVLGGAQNEEGKFALRRIPH